MIDIKDLVKNKNKYIVAYNNRQINLVNEIEKVVFLQKEYLIEIAKENDLRSELNSISKSIGQDPKNLELKKKASNISNKAKQVSYKSKKIKDEITKIVSHFPNVPMSSVSIGKDEKENVVLKEFSGIKANNSKPHWDIIKEKEMTLNEEAGIISGARQVIYNDKGAQLLKAIEKFMLDSHNSSGYRMVEVPVIVNKQALWNTAQLPKFEEDLYKLETGQYLIPTAEVPITNLAANKIFKEKDLPLRYYGITPCFRKEAGSAGKDTRGLIRLHQFRKVELVTFGKKSDEKKDFSEMLRAASQILKDLKIKHRYLELCTGDMGFASRKTIDIEVWMPGQKKWIEVSSVSTVGDFQSRRLKSKVNINGEKELINTYNGSALALGRTVAAVIENYYNEETKKIKIPKVLTKYLDFDEF